MSVHLARDMESLKKQILSVGALVEEAAWKAMTAVFDRKPELAQAVIDGDREVDALEVETEEDCLKILALHQPVARDLRFVAAVLKINNDLERVGDLASSIAARAIDLADGPPIQLPEQIREMAQASRKMLSQALDAFVRRDETSARRVCFQDARVDELHRTLRKQLTQLIKNESEIDRALSLLTVIRNLERIADHATNIAEDVVYLVSGEIVRHPGLPETVQEQDDRG